MKINYERYVYSKTEYIRYGITGFFSMWLLLMLFYDFPLLCLMLSIPFTFGFLKYYKTVLINKRRRRLAVSFKDFTEALISALSAGYSMENAVSEVKKDLMLIYSDKDFIICEIQYILQQTALNIPLDDLFSDWGERSGCEDIIDFARIYNTAKKSGGNLITVMKQTAKNIGDKIEIKREIDTMISGKKLESKIMCLIPLFIIIYLRVFSPGFMDPLYEGIGRLIMTGAMAVYVGSVLWIRRIYAKTMDESN